MKLISAKNGRISVGEESEVVREGKVVDVAPDGSAVSMIADEGGNQQEQRAFGLMEIGDHAPHNVEFVAGHDDYLRGGMEAIVSACFHPAQDGAQRLQRGDVVSALIGHPLGDVELFFAGIGMTEQDEAYVIKAFERAYGGSAYGNSLASVSYQLLDGSPTHDDVL